MKIPDGYTPITIDDFFTLARAAGVDVIGDLCAQFTDVDRVNMEEAIRRMTNPERYGVTHRAAMMHFVIKEDERLPGVFLAPDSDMAQIPGHRDIALALVRMFATTGDYDSRSGAQSPYLVDQAYPIQAGYRRVPVAEWVIDSTIDARRIAEDARMSYRNAIAAFLRLEQAGYLRIERKINRERGDRDIVRTVVDDASKLTGSERLIVRSLARLFDNEARGRFDPLLLTERGTKHEDPRDYVRAIEQQYAALESLTHAERIARVMGTELRPGVTAADNWKQEATILRQAETFCWFDEQTRGVVSAAVTLPDDVRLDDDLPCGRAGWWYFVHPIACQTTEIDHEITALAWAWVSTSDYARSMGSLRGITISAYVFRPGVDDAPRPSTQIFWKLGLTLAEMLTANAKSMIAVPDWNARADMNANASEVMARFFAAGSLWLKQRVLVTTPQRMERHARKRLEASPRSQLRPIADIQVIQLRRSESQPKSRPADADAKTVEWSCRWIVGGTEGFWRKQWFPSKGYRVPIHIDPYVKGPQDKPLKMPTHRVNVVNR